MTGDAASVLLTKSQMEIDTQTDWDTDFIQPWSHSGPHDLNTERAHLKVNSLFVLFTHWFLTVHVKRCPSSCLRVDVVVMYCAVDDLCHAAMIWVCHLLCVFPIDRDPPPWRKTAPGRCSLLTRCCCWPTYSRGRVRTVTHHIHPSSHLLAPVVVGSFPQLCKSLALAGIMTHFVSLCYRHPGVELPSAITGLLSQFLCDRVLPSSCGSELFLAVGTRRELLICHL